MSRYSLFLWVLAIAALIVLFSPRLIRKLTLALLGRSGKEAVGRRALAMQPDTITLVPSDRTPSPQAQSLLDGLRTEGFEPAGAFLVKEMGLLPVNFMVRPVESVTAAVYEHPS